MLGVFVTRRQLHFDVVDVFDIVVFTLCIYIKILYKITCITVILFLWFLCGVSLSFGPSFHGFIGNLQHSFLENVPVNAVMCCLLCYELFSLIFRMTGRISFSLDN